MFEYYYSYYGEQGYGIGLSLLSKYIKKYTKGSSSAPKTYSYSSTYYSGTPIGIGNVNKYIKAFKRPTSASAYSYYYGSGDSYGIGLSLLNF